MNNPAQLWQAAQQHLARNDAAGAAAQLRALLRVMPTHTHAHLLLGGLAHAGGDLRAATQHALDAAQTLPDDALVIGHVVNALILVGEMVKARECLAHAAIERCRDVGVLVNLASAQQTLGEHPQSLALFDRALALGLRHLDLVYIRGVQLMFNGRLDEAAEAFTHCLRERSPPGRAAVALARLRKQTRAENHLDLIDGQLRRVPRGTEDHAAFEFARYKELEDIGDFDAAWGALERGNAIMAARLRHNPEIERRLVDELIARCHGEFFQPAATTALREGPQPIFIVGMPRSGTTVLERLLGNHSQITSAGELGDFPRALCWSANLVTQLLLDRAIVVRAAQLDYAEIGRRYLAQTQWRAQGRAWFVDKLPANHFNVAFIARALPHAKILHMTRDPMDVCFSNYRAYFGEGHAYSYQFDTLTAYYADYRRLMDHWHRELLGRVLDVPYVSLVRDPEDTARAIFDFCELPLEADITDLQRNTAPTATLSTMQVREGIHQRAQREWERYSGGLAPLKQSLRDRSVL